MPNLVTNGDRSPIFQWHVVRCGSKNGYQKDLYSKETGVCTSIMITMLGIIVKVIGGGGDLCNYLRSMRIFILIMNDEPI